MLEFKWIGKACLRIEKELTEENTLCNSVKAIKLFLHILNLASANVGNFPENMVDDLTFTSA